MDNIVFRPWRQALALRGRATRREVLLLYLQLGLLLLALLLVSIDQAGAPPGGTTARVLDGAWLLFYVVAVVTSLSASVRRLHDQDKSGWLSLLGFVPLVGWLVLLVFMLIPGTLGTNRYGHDPRQGSKPSAALDRVFS